MSSRLKISLALLAGVCGLVLAGANLPIDTQLTIRTKLGKRVYPYWLVQPDSKVAKTEGGSGLIRLVGGLLGCAGFAAAMHLAGSDERQQRLFWAKQIAIDTIGQKEGEVTAEINAGVRLKKLQMDAQADIDFYSLQLQGKFREAIGFMPGSYQNLPPALPHGKPGTLDEITNPSDKIESDVSSTKLPIETSDPLTQTLLASQIGAIVFSGFLKLIGAAGSGKTTMCSALLRCRINRGHRLIIVNPHKAKLMYREINRYLIPGTKIYGVGLGDRQRADSLKEGLDKVLDILSKRYDEYQNEAPGKYDHFPITVLLEEVGEWEPFLALVMSENEVDTYLKHFWRKLFIAARKGKIFPLVTAQIDTQAMFVAKGLSGLVKESGAVTLTLTAEPDPNSEDGWKPSGKGRLKAPNSKPVDAIVPCVRSLISDVDYFGDCYRNTNGGEVVETPPTSTTSPPSPHVGLHQLESLLHQDSTNLHPIPANWQFPDPMQPLAPEVRAVVVSCKRSNLSQDATIKAVWGISKSGSDKRYEAARNHYRSVVI